MECQLSPLTAGERASIYQTQIRSASLRQNGRRKVRAGRDYFPNWAKVP
jgi:hypothetical protein